MNNYSNELNFMKKYLDNSHPIIPYLIKFDIYD
jgi:hypothetical protein